MAKRGTNRSRRLWAVFCGALLAAAAAQSATQAAEWIYVAETNNEIYETDLSTLKRTGDVAVSWSRSYSIKAVGKSSAPVLLTERHDDCSNRRYAFGTFVKRDARGEVVDRGDWSKGWQAILPGSVAEGIWRVNCAATTEPKDEAFFEQIGGARCTSLGASADKSQTLHVALEDAAYLDDQYVLSFTRSDYNAPQWVEDLPILYVVSAEVIDCKNGKSAEGGADLYVSPTRRVLSTRPDPATLKFESPAPGTFAAGLIPRACAAAKSAGSVSAKSQADTLASGTAWAAVKGYLVTASHVVSGAKSIAVYDNGAQVGGAVVVADDPANDLAVLRVTDWKGRRLLALPIAPRSASLGRSVFVLGYPQPGVMGQKIKMTAGEVSSTAGPQDDARYLQISAPIQEGNSGGPVIGWDGAVLGVVEAKLTGFDGETALKPEMVNYAMKVSYLRPLLDELPDLANYDTLKPAAGEDLIAIARNAVFMVVVAQ